MSDLVERVARQISGAPFPSERSKTKARAAIAEVFDAMMEPSEEMLEALWRVISIYHPFQADMGRGVEADAYQAMLTQARAEAGV
jgi:hypothetical protein